MAPVLLLRALVAGLSAAFLLFPLPGVALIPPPAADPFYTAPNDLASTKPGTVLRSREVTVAAFAALPQNLQHAYQILYRTTSAVGEPQATVTTLLVPFKASTSPAKLLSYQTAEDSPSAQCAPSYQLRFGAGNQGFFTQAELTLIDAILQRGWIVAVPDYEGPWLWIETTSDLMLKASCTSRCLGPNSAFVAGIQAGQGVLDGIRASLAFPAASLGVSTTRVGLLGYSGGAWASAWASELQSSYAPELQIAGIAQVRRRLNCPPFSAEVFSIDCREASQSTSDMSWKRSTKVRSPSLA
jgi:Secretory lipase